MPGRLAKWGATGLTWCGLLLAVGMGYADDQTAPKEAPPVTAPAAVVVFPKVEAADAGEDAAERKALEAAIVEFARTFNAHDLPATLAHYADQAELTDQGGKITRGRSAISDAFTKLFAEQPEIKIHLEVQSLRFLSPGLAIEDGVSTMSIGADTAEQAGQRDRYTVTHVKLDGKWVIAGARDWAPAPATAEEQLKQLEWLVGEWVDENSNTLVHTNYHWSADKRYLFSKYLVQREGQPAVEGLQRIGWDPNLKQLHSWTFDSAGGFTEGLWSRAGDQWIVKITGTLADGRMRSATNVLTRLGPDHATYQSRDRVIGSEVQPDLDTVPIVRKPPQPSLPMVEVKAAEKEEPKDTESK